MQVIEAFEGQVSIAKRLQWSGINPSSFYYVARNGKPGRNPSSVNLKTDGSNATNHEVVEEIKKHIGHRIFVLWL